MRIPCYTQGLVLDYTKTGKNAPTDRANAGRAYGTDPRAQKGYGGLMGLLRYIKRRPRRLEQRTKACDYCGLTPDGRPVVATAVNSSGRPVDIKRLSAPHCKNCGTMVA